MTENRKPFPEQGRFLLAGAPEGYDAVALARELSAAGGDGPCRIHVARDAGRANEMAAALRFFAPGIRILSFPAWDCLPYDRVSPNREVAAQRISVLAAIARLPRRPRTPTVVVTTVNAILQRVPARAQIGEAVLHLEAGRAVAPDRLRAFFARNGFERAGSVREPGEFALRGGIVDLFPPGEERPFRLDFLGDELETVRVFDPASQRATGAVRDAVTLLPASEVPLDEDSVARFRAGYRNRFGAVTEDPLYVAVTEGRRQIGMEHWLPLFVERLETLFDYLPDAPVTLDHECEQARDARIEIIRDYHDARMTFLESRPAAMADAPPYRPLPPEMLHLDAAEFERALGSRAVGQFFPFAAPGDGATSRFAAVLAQGGLRAPDFVAADAGPTPGGEPGVRNPWERLAAYARQETGRGRRFVVAGFSEGSRKRMGQLLRAAGLTEMVDVGSWNDGPADGTVGLAVLPVEHGFRGGDVSLVTEQDVLGERIVRADRRRRRADDFIADLSEISEGDLVVHLDHGIGRYEGLEALDVAGAPHDCLRIAYADENRLFLPVENIEMLSRYGTTEAPLDRLGSHVWQARKARMRNRLRAMADQLIRVAAERGLRAGPPVRLDPERGRRFAAAFAYEETEDQAAAIDETLGDLESGRPMDRLVCGDVGFGKTEVALRAAFATAASGAQVAVVVPTTLLCRQHFATFRDRFAGTGFEVAQLSRLVPAAAARKIRAGMADGAVDIVIGTHALLSRTVRFANLGLVVVDEEQRFGVGQKEALKRLKTGVHVLTLSATPIPRTLQMALTGVRDLSLIGTPPVDRLAIRTFVAPHDPVMIREAVLREHFRGGQTFYVCPRIADLDGVAEDLRNLVPEVKIAVAHGRMSADRLDEVVSSFYEQSANLLLSTQIVESGLDIPTANTMIVHRADRYGLAQLYQLRGRIGRSRLRAYCYMLLPHDRKLTESARRRLEALQALDTLGAGFTLASHDLDIRGAGNLLGDEQSGHIREVGVELYQHLLEEAMAEARGEAGPSDEDWSPAISLGLPVLIPDGYVADLGVRLALYRRLAGIADVRDIDGFAAEMIDRFGPLPEPFENLLEVVAVKRECRLCGIEKLDAGPKGAVIAFHAGSPPDPEAVVRLVTEGEGRYRLRPDNTLVCRESWSRPGDRLRGARRLVERLAELAAVSPAGRDAPRRGRTE